MPEFTPSINKSLKARYKDQSSVYENLVITGPLTDEAIYKYALQGRYGEKAKENAERERDARLKRTAKQTERAMRKKLLNEYA